jgi:hypothetical protein
MAIIGGNCVGLFALKLLDNAAKPYLLSLKRM